jgi:hypothetical protein
VSSKPDASTPYIVSRAQTQKFWGDNRRAPAMEGRYSALPVMRSLCCAPCADLCCAPCALPLCAPCAPCARALCRVWCALAAHVPLRAPLSLGACLCASLSFSPPLHPDPQPRFWPVSSRRHAQVWAAHFSRSLPNAHAPLTSRRQPRFRTNPALCHTTARYLRLHESPNVGQNCTARLQPGMNGCSGAPGSSLPHCLCQSSARTRGGC